jgi:excisionase family DNA binding protein
MRQNHHENRRIMTSLSAGVTGGKDLKMSDYPEILTLQQAAEFLQVSTRTMQRMVKAKEIPGRQVGGQWRFDRDQLKEWVRGEGGATATARAQQELIEREARKLGVDLPQTLIDLQQAALKRASEKNEE